jgi:uncharacterized protein YcbX
VSAGANEIIGLSRDDRAGVLRRNRAQLLGTNTDNLFSLVDPDQERAVRPQQYQPMLSAHPWALQANPRMWVDDGQHITVEVQHAHQAITAVR